MHPSAPVWAPLMHSPLLRVLTMTKTTTTKTKTAWKPPKWMEQKYLRGTVKKPNGPELLGLPHKSASTLTGTPWIGWCIPRPGAIPSPTGPASCRRHGGEGGGRTSRKTCLFLLSASLGQASDFLCQILCPQLPLDPPASSRAVLGGNDSLIPFNAAPPPCQLRSNSVSKVDRPNGSPRGLQKQFVGDR